MGGIDGANWPKKRWRGPLKCAHLSRAPCFAGARSVLGLPVEQVVRAAWPTELLEQGQQWYCENAQRNWDALRLKQLPQKSLWVCARETNRAFRAVMAPDPLLPKALWPDRYRGAEVIAWHRRLLGELVHQLA